MTDYTQTSTFKDFAWDSLTGDQQVRICLKYELTKKLEEIKPGEKKRDVYRYIAEKFGSISWQFVEKVAFHMKKASD